MFAGGTVTCFHLSPDPGVTLSVRCSCQQAAGGRELPGGQDPQEAPVQPTSPQGLVVAGGTRTSKDPSPGVLSRHKGP